MLRRYAMMPAISAVSSANGGMPAAGEPALMKRASSVSVDGIAELSAAQVDAADRVALGAVARHARAAYKLAP